MTVELTHGDLADGTLTSEVLVYQSYKGSTTATGPVSYTHLTLPTKLEV